MILPLANSIYKYTKRFSRIQNVFRLMKKPRNAAQLWRAFIMMDIVIVFFILLIVYFKWFAPFTDPTFMKSMSKHLNHDGFFDRSRNLAGMKIDWHDYRLMAQEKRRTGIGEQGEAAFLSGRNKEQEAKMSIENGFNALLSDKISVNRSVLDLRHPDCQVKKYLKELPTVSVVFPVFDEHWSTLLRSIYSILNRSPPHLIKEIILVNDHSRREILYQPLQNYIDKHLPKVRLIHLPDRSGLIKARSEGARAATGDVLIFLDSHIEVTVNWLPPLLEPIAENYKVCVCPLIDIIMHDDFSYRMQDNGARGAFNWNFLYKRLPVLPRDLINPAEPFESPVMAGGLFAISSKYFWELGGYDEGIEIWGGEQYELSFKIWQCGGKMFDAPCSRIGHIYRGPRVNHDNPRTNDYVGKNFKRVAEVWMDEYAKYIYERDAERYAKVDVGDITKQLAIRDTLNCKPFKWFLEHVAPDLMEAYPPVLPPSYASGAVKLNSENLCVDMLSGGPLGLYPCSGNLAKPWSTQFFMLSWKKDIRQMSDEICWEANGHEPNAEIKRVGCHGTQGTQMWKYNYKTKMMHYADMARCLDADPDAKKLYVNKCDTSSLTQQWTWGFFNKTMIDKWDLTS